MYFIPVSVSVGEDCLYLNIFADERCLVGVDTHKISQLFRGKHVQSCSISMAGTSIMILL